MKKIIGIFAIVVLSSIVVSAQSGQGKGQKGMNYTPEQKATLQAKKMTLDLDLNATQQTAVYNLMKQNAEERQNTSAAMKQKKQDGVEISDDENFEMQKQRLDQQIAHKAAMKNILNKEQYEKWEKMMQQKNRQGKQNKTAQNKNNKGMQNGNPKNRAPQYKN